MRTNDPTTSPQPATPRAARLAKRDFEGSPVRVFEYQGRPACLADDIAGGLGYGSARRFTQNILGRWPELEAGVDYVIIDGAELDDLKCTGLVRKRRKSVVVLFESGMHLAAMLAKTPPAQRFRRWLASDLLPTLRELVSVARAHDPLARAAPQPSAAMAAEPPRLASALELEAVRGQPRAAATLLLANLAHERGLPKLATTLRVRALASIAGQPEAQLLEPRVTDATMRSSEWIAREVFGGREHASAVGKVAELLGLKTNEAIAAGLSIQVEGAISRGPSSKYQLTGYFKPTIEWRYSAAAIERIRAAHEARARHPKRATWDDIVRAESLGFYPQHTEVNP